MRFSIYEKTGFGFLVAACLVWGVDFTGNILVQAEPLQKAVFMAAKAPAAEKAAPAAKAEGSGFKYSDALKGLGGDWSYQDLDAFLVSPKAFAKGTKMSFKGLSKAKDRAAVIAYLRSLSDQPKPLP